MKGRSQFTAEQAEQIRATLDLVARARRDGDKPRAKSLRDSLRATGFYISDWDASGSGFERSDFDALVATRRIAISHRPA